MRTPWKWMKNFLPGLFLLALIPAALTFHTASASAREKTVERIDTFVTQQVERHHLPGLALALVEGNQVIFMKGYGKADQSGRPVTPQTPFILASVSKPLTATAIMQLIEAGQIELDAPVQRYLPEFQLADPVASRQITVRHLLLHTSGIPSTACDTRMESSTLAEYVAELQTVNPAAPVGTQHIYCSGNYNVLGRILEVVAGQSFGEYMQENIFKPLDMRHSFTSEEAALSAGLAQGYQWFFGLRVPTHHHYNTSQLPSGYMISSVEDMSHFLVAQLNAGRYAGSKILSAESLGAMRTQGATRRAGGEYGFGWVISPFGDVPAVWHDGVNVNFHSLILMQPHSHQGVVVLMNSFGIVSYESAYKELEQGLVRLMAGLEPGEPGQSLGSLYFIINVLLAISLALALLPLIRMRRWQHWLSESQRSGKLPRVRILARSVWELGFALAFLAGIRLFIVAGLGPNPGTRS